MFIPDGSARWFAQLDGEVDAARTATFFYLDAEQQELENLAEIHASGRHYICYLSAGSVEAFRNDANEFPARAVGSPLSSFPNERWLDIRDVEVQRLMERRVERLAASGCDAIVPASLNGYALDSGFDLTLSDTVVYATWLAERVHDSGMSIGLTAPAELLEQVVPAFDFGLAISCVTGSGCSEYEPLLRAQKPVLHVEPGDAETAPELCKSAQALGFELLISDAGFRGDCLMCEEIR